MKAGPIEIGRLLQNRQRFCVPIYQRHYVWNKQKQWEPFWKDVRTKAIECLAGRERRFSHFMGAVVLESRGGFSAGRVPAFQVVDGQQRLTTFQLFLAAARDYSLHVGFQASAEKIVEYLLNDKPHLMEDKEVEVFKVWPTQYDRNLFIDILTLGRESLRKKYSDYFYVKQDKVYEYKHVPNLLGAYGYFFDRIKHSVETDDLDDEFAGGPDLDESEDNIASADLSDAKLREIKLDSIWRALVEEFKVVEINLEEGDDAQVIFETLNERGEPLLAADLIRNNIFHRADAAGEKADHLFSTHWKSFEDPFWSMEEKQGRYKKPRIEFFLANFISGQIAGEVNLGKLFSEYKAFLKPSKSSKRSRFLSVTEEIKELVRASVIYRDLIERSSNSALANFAARLYPWDVTTVFPLVMRLWGSPTMAEAQKVDCLKMLLSFIVRRAICGLTTKNYNRFFLMAIAHLDQIGWSSLALGNFLLDQKQESGRMPRDDEFEQKWLFIPAYRTLQSTRTKAVLSEIEIRKRTSYHETDKLAEGLSVEHVMPSYWLTNWPMPDGSKPTQEEFYSLPSSDYSYHLEGDSRIGRIVRRNRLIDSFGNLTLLTRPLNSTVSNGAYVTKRAALKDHSLLVLNRELTRQDDWHEETILERGAALFSVAKDVWPLPKYSDRDGSSIS